MFHHGPSPTSRFVFSAALVLLVSSMVGSVSCASDLPDIPPIERLGTVSSTFTERTQRITTNTDVAIVHNQLLSTIFDPVPWPITTQATLVATYDSASFPSLNSVGIPTAGVSKVEELSFTTSINGLSHTTRAYHLLPAPAIAKNRLVIVHHGHGNRFQQIGGGDPYGLSATLAQFLTNGYAVLAMYMPNYHPTVNTTPTTGCGASPNGSIPWCNGTGTCNAIRDIEGEVHDVIFCQHGTAAFRAYLQPIASCINWLRTNYDYRDFSMAGISGGGWTTVLYSALDGSIRNIAPVSGSLPLDLRTTDFGDTEQNYPGVYGGTGVAGYRDLYTLGAYGNRRKHVQIQNHNDICCFSSLQHPSLATDMTTYKMSINSRLATAGGASPAFDFYLPTDNAPSWAHTITANGRSRIYNDVVANPPLSSQLFLYHAVGGVGVEATLFDGKYQYAGQQSGFSTSWSHVVMTKNNGLFFYRSSDGLSGTAVIGDNGSYTYMGLASSVGAG
jgi:hypothetical protein